LQDRLTKELALAGIDAIEPANAFIRDVYIPAHNARFAIAAEQDGSAFVAIPGVDLAEILCVQEERDVGNDNCVLQDPKAANSRKPVARPFRQGARQGPAISRRDPCGFPRAKMPWALRSKGSLHTRENGRLSSLDGRPAEMWTTQTRCPQSRRRTKAEEADI
jgi:hypothetical protein